MTIQVRRFKSGVEIEAVNWNSGVTAGDGVRCLVANCGQWFPHHPALIAHMVAAHTIRSDATQAAVTPDEMPWEVLLEEIEAKPGLWFDEEVYDPSLDFDALLAEMRAADDKCALAEAEQRDFNYGWDAFFFGRIPDDMNEIQRAGHEAARAEFEESVIAERQLFEQIIERE
jgi:hypothetical protein